MVTPKLTQFKRRNYAREVYLGGHCTLTLWPGNFTHLPTRCSLLNLSNSLSTIRCPSRRRERTSRSSGRVRELDCTCEPCALKTTKVPPALKDHFVAELCNEYRRLYRLEKPGAGHLKHYSAAKIPYIVGSWDIFEFGEGLWVWMYRNRRFAHSYPRPRSARRNASLSFRWHHNLGHTEWFPWLSESRQRGRRCADDCAASAQDTGTAEISCGHHPVQPKTRRRVCLRWLAVLDDGIRSLLHLPQRQLS